MTSMVAERRGTLPVVNLNAVIVGALLALLADFALTLLGSGVGLMAFQSQNGLSVAKKTFILSGVFSVCATFCICFIGGYVAARLSKSRHTWEAVVHGIASFALTSFMMIFLMGGPEDTPLEGVLSKTQLSIEAPIRVIDFKTDFVDRPQTQVIGDIQGSAATASFSALGLLIVGVLSSAWGGSRGYKSALQISAIPQEAAGTKPAN